MSSTSRAFRPKLTLHIHQVVGTAADPVVLPNGARGAHHCAFGRQPASGTSDLSGNRGASDCLRRRMGRPASSSSRPRPFHARAPQARPSVSTPPHVRACRRRRPKRREEAEHDRFTPQPLVDDTLASVASTNARTRDSTDPDTSNHSRIARITSTEALRSRPCANLGVERRTRRQNAGNGSESTRPERHVVRVGSMSRR